MMNRKGLMNRLSQLEHNAQKIINEIRSIKGDLDRELNVQTKIKGADKNETAKCILEI